VKTAAALTLALLSVALMAHAQAAPVERTFAQSKSAVEAALRKLEPTAAGRLPTLDGFIAETQLSLDRFQRGYYRCDIQVTASPGGGSKVRVAAKITAWYNAPEAAKSGYQVLSSNGRLESDLLDRLEDALGTHSAAAAESAPRAKPGKAASAKASDLNLPSAPSFPSNAFPSDARKSYTHRNAAAPQQDGELDREAKGLEEILRNQSHPTNLVAVREKGAPVLVSPIEGAKVLFVASAEDEFEILDSNESWVHVRISGLSRGWIRRANLEMPDSADGAEDAATPPPAQTQAAPASAASGAASFQIENQQTATFPGDWAPLQGKVVWIVSVQNNGGQGRGQDRVQFVRGLLKKEYANVAKSASSAEGIVVIFDSADGGMVAVTVPVLREWSAGAISDEAMWRRCYVDPPEMFPLPGGQ